MDSASFTRFLQSQLTCHSRIALAHPGKDTQHPHDKSRQNCRQTAVLARFEWDIVSFGKARLSLRGEPLLRRLWPERHNVVCVAKKIFLIWPTQALMELSERLIKAVVVQAFVVGNCIQDPVSGPVPSSQRTAKFPCSGRDA